MKSHINGINTKSSSQMDLHECNYYCMHEYASPGDPLDLLGVPDYNWTGADPGFCEYFFKIFLFRNSNKVPNCLVGKYNFEFFSFNCFSFLKLFFPIKKSLPPEQCLVLRWFYDNFPHLPPRFYFSRSLGFKDIWTSCFVVPLLPWNSLYQVHRTWTRVLYGLIPPVTVSLITYIIY